MNDSYEVRNTGDNIAEKRMKEYFKRRGMTVCRNGFDEKHDKIPTEDFWKMPKVIRSSPDYIVVGQKAVFVEVKGYMDNLKVKVSDMLCYSYWNSIMPLYIFAYEARGGKHRLISFLRICQIVEQEDTIYNTYSDNGHRYFDMKIDGE